MSISWEIDKICKDIRSGKTTEHILITKDLLTHFGATDRSPYEIERINSWLKDRDIKCIPAFDTVNHDAEVKLTKTSHKDVNNEDKSRLLLRLLPCANADRSKIHYVLDTEKADDVVVLLKNNDLDYILTVSNTSRQSTNHLKPSGFITCKSLQNLCLFGQKQADETIQKYLDKNFYEFPDTTPLIDLIDRISHNQENCYIVIRNEKGQISGTADYSKIMKELYPYSKPFFVISLIETSLSKIIKQLNYQPKHIVNAMVGESAEKRRINPVPESLTMYEKITLLRTELLESIECKPSFISYLKGLYPDLIKVNEIRNIIAHYRPDPISIDDIKLLEKISQKLTSLPL
jgi:hypothetical protein